MSSSAAVRSRSADKKLLYQLAVARSDIKAAMDSADMVAARVDNLGHDLYLPLFHAAAVAYGRPFSKNRPLGPLSDDWKRFSDPRLQATHEFLIDARNRFIAHSDEQVRFVEVVPPGVPMAGYVTSGIGLQIHSVVLRLEDFVAVHDTCMDLGTRLNFEVTRLLGELYGGRQLPAESFRLSFDEGL